MNIIYNIIEQIQSDKWYGLSKEMEIAKGKNKLIKSRKERLEKIKRRFFFLLKKQN